MCVCVGGGALFLSLFLVISIVSLPIEYMLLTLNVRTTYLLIKLIIKWKSFMMCANERSDSDNSYQTAPLDPDLQLFGVC